MQSGACGWIITDSFGFLTRRGPKIATHKATKTAVNVPMADNALVHPVTLLHTFHNCKKSMKN